MTSEEKNKLNDFLNKKQAVDDFEKEALEGFSQYSMHELELLKQKTDAKAEKLFEKKNKRVTFWLTAAIVVFCMGLLIKLFIPTESIVNNSKIAINNKLESDVEKLKEEQFNNDTETSVLKRSNENSLQNKDSQANLTQKTTSEASPNKTEPNKVQVPKSDMIDPVTTLSKGLEEKPNLPAEEKNYAASGSIVKDEESKAETKSTSLINSEKKEESKKKTSTADKISTSAPAQYGLEDGDVAISENNLYYDGGDKKLISDLRELLKTINLNTAFDVLIMVNDKSEISSVEFIDERELTKDEKNSIKKEIKKLTKFKYKIQPSKNTKSHYKIIYRP